MIRSQRFPQFQLIVHHARGSLTPKDLRDSVAGSHEGEVMPLEVWDLTESDLSGFDLQTLGDLLAELFHLVPHRDGEMTALVLKGATQTELAGVFQRMAEFQEFSVAIRSFQDLQSAMVWLFGGEWKAPLEAVLSDPSRPGPGSR